MTSKVLPVLSAILLVFTPAAIAAPPTQAEIEKLIVGKWNGKEVKNDLTTQVVIEYRKDGMLAGEMTLTRKEKSVKVVVTGRWEVSGTKVTETYETSTPPAIPAGKRSTDEVLEINEKIYRVRGDDGVERTLTRIKN